MTHAWSHLAAASWDRFLSFVRRPADPDACWLWGGAKSRGSGHRPWYGSFRVGRFVVRAHIFVCVARGDRFGRRPFPGCHIDHICLNTLCVNWRHLEVVPARVNAARRAAADRAARELRRAA